uniref:UBD domain-containing protein n=1 Tax=Glossina pallidipes TaxID=7398 RepID=A0A1B0A679_GLOPL
NSDNDKQVTSRSENFAFLKKKERKKKVKERKYIYAYAVNKGRTAGEMGSCMGRYSGDNETVSVSSASASRPPTGPQIGAARKNRPLCHETIRWRSDVPLTEGQLRSKRDEFWDTAPAFDGRKEIWDALRAATTAAEGLDFQLAQAILDGANVSVPNGYLTECYDELGTQYKVPIYCLSYPINIVKEENGRDSPAEFSEPVDGGNEIFLKLRVSSTMSDIKLPVYSKDTVGQCKKKLQVSLLHISKCKKVLGRNKFLDMPWERVHSLPQAPRRTGSK